MTRDEFVIQLMLLGWKPSNLDDPRYHIYEFNVIHVISIVYGASSSPTCGYVRYHEVGDDDWNRQSFANYAKALEFLTGDFDGS